MKKITFFVLTGIIFLAVAARADMSQIKAYKEAYPDGKPKCINCHVDAMPKKDGSHENNDYGKAALKAAQDAKLDKPTADTFKKIGPIPATN